MQLKQRQIVLVGRVVSMPCDDVERRVIDERRPEPAQKLRRDVKFAFAVFEGRDGRFESRAGWPSRWRRWPEFRQAEGQAVVLADVSASLLSTSSTRNLTPRGMTQISPGATRECPAPCESESSQLRHDQQLAVGAIEEAVPHGGVGGVEVDGDAGLHGRVAVAAERDDAVDEIGLLFGNRQRIPAQLIGRGRRLSERSAANQLRGDLFIGAMSYRRADAIGPGAAIGGPRSRKRRAAELLGVEAEGMLLRRVLAHAATRRQRPRSQTRCRSRSDI